VDIDILEIPDCLTMSLVFFGLLGSAIFPEIHGTANVLASVQRSLLGLLCGAGMLLWIGVLGEQIFKKEAIGFGDVKLIGAIGSFCGIDGCLYAIFGGSMVGTLALIPILIKVRITAKNRTNISVLPFAPFLSLGTVLFIFFGERWFPLAIP
jgi:leader peptidase (prepilin peptidase)/N-methyltransferase